jgi:hypothetical protein
MEVAMTMKRFRLVRAARLLATILAFLACLTATEDAAIAKGTAVVTQSNGSRNVYHNVFIIVRGSAMSLKSSDGKFKLTIGKTDCTKVGHLLRCNAYDATLDQLGEANHAPLRSGTAWLDLLGEPHDVRLSFQTKAGATVSASGTIDELEK